MTIRWKTDFIETPREWIESLQSWVTICQRDRDEVPVRYLEVVPAVERAIVVIGREWAHDLDHGQGEKPFPFVITPNSGADPAGCR